MPILEPTHNDLPGLFASLEASLLYWRHLDAGIWPIYDWEESDLKAYTRQLYPLAHEFLAMHLHIDAPEVIPFITKEDDWLEQKQLITLIQQLLLCCDEEQASGFRSLSAGEQQLIATLGQIQAAVIGAYYRERPGETTADSDFIPGKNS